MAPKKPDVKGGNGNIFFDNENGTATKYLRNISSQLSINRFVQEQEALKFIISQNISNIVDVLEIHIDKNDVTKSFIKMKKYDGSLYDLFSVTNGNVKASLKLILPIVKALKKLSESEPKIIHRDLKPDNILYLQNGDTFELYLTDFGICFLFDDNERLTPKDMAVGARMFLAPEYEVGRVENITEKGDIFSIGKIIWCMINGDTEALLPSNFWFVDAFDLQKLFPTDRDMISANLVIASCLRINPDCRSNYENLIALIDSILEQTTDEPAYEKEVKVKLFQAKRDMELNEILKMNKLIVNYFSLLYLDALQDISLSYPSLKLIQKLREEYSARARNGSDFTSSNVDNCSAHYLYSASYDNIYLAIHYNPPTKGELYANITLEYRILSKQKNDNIKVKYDINKNLSVERDNAIASLNKRELVLFLEDLVSNYCDID